MGSKGGIVRFYHPKDVRLGVISGLKRCKKREVVGATSNEPQKPSDSKKKLLKLKKLEICQNSKRVKTEKFYKLGPKTCTPPRFWEGKTRGSGIQLGLPLS